LVEAEYDARRVAPATTSGTFGTSLDTDALETAFATGSA
jgi:hypothetical protein